MTRDQVYSAVERFLKDEGRVISEENLCDLAGISYTLFKHIFKYKTRRLTPTIQLRMEKALGSIERGEVKVVRNPNHTVTVGYRRKPQPEFSRGYGLTVKNGRIAIKTGLVNVNDYSEPTFKEELEDKWPS